MSDSIVRSLRQNHPWRVAVLAGTLCVVTAMAACGGGGGKSRTMDDPVTVAKDLRRDAPERIEAVKQMWADRLPGEKGRDVAREALKSIAWVAANGSKVRTQTLQILLDDSGDTGHADTRSMMALMVPIEPDLEIVAFIGATAAANGWNDLSGPLVRSWARRVPNAKDDARPEKAAFIGLFGAAGMQRAVFDIFATPVSKDLAGRAVQRASDARRSAWEVLSRLDPTGAQRAPLLAALPDGTGDVLVDGLRACSAEFRCTPTTGSQLRRLERLRDFSEAANKAWWEETSKAIAGIDQARTAGIAMRNLEAIRWTATNNPERLNAEKSSLLADLRGQLKGRMTVRRTVGDISGSSFSKDGLGDWADELSWADLVTIMAVDDAVMATTLRKPMFEQAKRDEANITTEYGGLLRWKENAGWAVVLYVPRPGGQVDDRRFVASEEMMADGTRALAHYHFHAQQVFNRDYAGPSPGDYEYAVEQGMPCVVLTPIREGVMNADYYHTGGVTIDLGDVREVAK